MNRCISSSRRITAAFFATAVIALSGSVFAQTVDQVLQADQRRLNLAQQSQERINKIVEGTRSLEDQYRSINKEIDGLKVYNRLMKAQVEGQSAVLEDISLSMDQVDVINRQIFPLDGTHDRRPRAVGQTRCSVFDGRAHQARRRS